MKVSVCVDSARQPVPSPQLSYVTRPNHSSIICNPFQPLIYHMQPVPTTQLSQLGLLLLAPQSSLFTSLRQIRLASLNRYAGRHRDIQTDTQTFRQPHRHSDRRTHIQTDIHTFSQKRKHSDRHKHSDRRPNIQADTQACRQTYKHSNTNTNIQADSHAGRHATEI